MANEQNLIPFNQMTESQQRAIQSAGGKASQEKRKERKKMKEQAELLLSLPFKDREDENGESLLSYYKRTSNIDDAEEIDNQMAMIIAMFNVVLGGGKGSVQAFNSLRELVGEKQTDVNLNGGVNINFDGESEIED